MSTGGSSQSVVSPCNCFQVFFDSLYSLITHYQQNPLVSPKFSITLGRAVPPPNQHEGKPWFHPRYIHIN